MGELLKSISNTLAPQSPQPNPADQEYYIQRGQPPQAHIMPDTTSALTGGNVPVPQAAAIDRWLPLIGGLGAAATGSVQGGVGGGLGGLLGGFAQGRYAQQQLESEHYRQALAAQLANQRAQSLQAWRDEQTQYHNRMADTAEKRLNQPPRLTHFQEIGSMLAREAGEADPTNPAVIAKYYRPTLAFIKQEGIDQATAKAKAAAEARLNAEKVDFSTADPAQMKLPVVGPTAAPKNRPVNEEVLQSVSPGIQNLVRALVQYRIPLPTGFALKSPYWQQVMNLATQYDPTFDATQYGVRLGVRKDFTAGPTSKAVNALNTVIGHLDTMNKRASEIGNTWSRTYNRLGNWLSKETGNPKVTNFEVARAAVARELTRVFRGTGGAEADVQEWQRTIDSAGSPAQLQGAINQAIALLESRIEALQNTYERGMGHPLDFQLLSPDSQRILNRLKGQSAGLSPDEAASGLPSIAQKYLRQ